MKKRNVTEELVKIAMMTAVLSVLSILQIPMPSGVPLTLQTFAVAVCGYFLGARKGFFAVGLYLLIGMAGFPVFSGMKGGIGVLTGPTGGFLVGFLGMVSLCGTGAAMSRRMGMLSGLAGLVHALEGLAGLGICHLFGVLWFALLMHQSPKASFLAVSLPYLVKDAVSVFGAAMVSKTLRRGLGRAGLNHGVQNE